jgi:hypothetical protein
LSEAEQAEVKGLEPSYSVDPEKFEKVSGLRINPKILEVRPQGSRLIAILNPPPEEYGLIAIPETIRSSERSGSGWVLSCGPLVGQQCPHPGGPIGVPWDLLYKQIIFGSTTGRIIRVDFLDRETKSPYLIFTDRDIWAIDLNPTENKVKEIA